jgi:hyperosmotically inducible periplasmic protein
MLKQKFLLTAALLGIPMVSATMMAGCASTAQHESTGQYADSSGITLKVKAKLLADKFVSGTAIQVKTFKNVVQLSGFVNTLAQKQRAVQITRSVEGVERVEDSILVK